MTIAEVVMQRRKAKKITSLKSPGSQSIAELHVQITRKYKEAKGIFQSQKENNL